MSQSPQRSFLDRNTIIAIVVTMLFMIGWQKYMEKKYPKAAVTAPATSATPAAALEQSKEVSQSVVAGSTAEVPAQESTLILNSDKFEFEISSFGMGVKSALLKSYTDRKNQPIRVVDQPEFLVFGTYAMGQAEPVKFNMQKVDEYTVTGEGVSGNSTFTKTIKVNPVTYSVEVTTKIASAQVQNLGFDTYLSETLYTYPKAFLVPSYEHQEFHYQTAEKSKHVMVNAEGTDDVSEPAVSVAAMSTPFFTQALINKSDILPSVLDQTVVARKKVNSKLTYKTPDVRSEFTVQYLGYLGPKSVDVLKNVDEKAVSIVDLGFFAMLAKPLLALMKILQSFVGNWGVAIILLTLIVRLIVLPFNISSYRSMKKMQDIQGPMKVIRERYKDDQQRMNLEVMNLMRKEKVNPIGGCLPMLLQLPIFFALYQVFAKSIELYKAPFALWIQDLSFKDPYYVLPVANALVMFFQQKITPSTMDESQRKMMMIMPLVFSVFMLSLPSGLTLYWFVSTLFGFIQQYMFMRNSSTAPKAARA